MSDKESLVVRNPFGYFQFSPLPTEEELSAFYQNEYWTKESANYRKQHGAEEYLWLKNRAAMNAAPIISRYAGLRGEKKPALLDVGCGEGFFMDFMAANGWDVWGMDFSGQALENYHPHLLPKLILGDIYALLEKTAASGKKYDAIFCANVIEHVREPEKLVGLLGKILASPGILAIVAPNDFSSLQKYITESGKTNKKWWLTYPDHLNYFNKESMLNVLREYGLSAYKIMSDYPIEFNLFAPEINYVEKREMGHAVHLKRMRMENYLFEYDPDILQEIYASLGSRGIGRNLAYYCCPLHNIMDNKINFHNFIIAKS